MKTSAGMTAFRTRSVLKRMPGGMLAVLRRWFIMHGCEPGPPRRRDGWPRARSLVRSDIAPKNAKT